MRRLFQIGDGNETIQMPDQKQVAELHHFGMSGFSSSTVS